MKPEQIAKVCHEVNRAYCMSLGDGSQPAWDYAPQWQKDSAMAGVELHINDIYAGPEKSHENWMKQKIEDGWRFGREKDADAKEHPCLVPFGALPVEQRAKDFIFTAIVHQLKDL